MYTKAGDGFRKVRQLSRVVVVTGGSSGIGKAVVARFAADGDDVIALGRGKDGLERLRDDLHSGGARPLRTFVCDVTDAPRVEAVFDEIGPLDVLVNNAGDGESAPLGKTTLASWDAQHAVNATGPFLCTRAALPHLQKRGCGAIVTIASTAGRAGSPYTAAYTASKHAAVGLMRAVAAEVAGTRIRANAVCPTFVETPLTERSVQRIVAATGRDAEESRAALAANTPLGRLLEPAEVAEAVHWLASDGARAVNGQAIVLDGGGVQA